MADRSEMRREQWAETILIRKKSRSATCPRRTAAANPIVTIIGGLSGEAGGNDPAVAEESSKLVQVEVLCDQAAPFAVRQALAKLDSLGQVLGDLLLIASELVTNAVLHSGCSREDVIRVRLDQAQDHVLLSVWDPGISGRSAAVAVAEQRSSGGLGLWLVGQLARRWGAERAAGYRVWAEVALSGSTSGEPRPV